MQTDNNSWFSGGRPSIGELFNATLAHQQYLVSVLNERRTDQRLSAFRARETLFVPRVIIQIVILARQNEVVARLAPLGKHVAVAIRTKVLTILHRECLARDWDVAVGTCEAVFVVCLAIVADAPLIKRLRANDTFLNERPFIAFHAYGQVLMSHESLWADWFLAELTDKARFVPEIAVEF